MKTRSRIYKNYNKDEEINLSIPNMPIVNIPVANIKTAKETVPYDNININEPFPRKYFTIVETKEYKNLNYKKIIFFSGLIIFGLIAGLIIYITSSVTNNTDNTDILMYSITITPHLPSSPIPIPITPSSLSELTYNSSDSDNSNILDIIPAPSSPYLDYNVGSPSCLSSCSFSKSSSETKSSYLSESSSYLSESSSYLSESSSLTDESTIIESPLYTFVNVNVNVDVDVESEQYPESFILSDSSTETNTKTRSRSSSGSKSRSNSFSNTKSISKSISLSKTPSFIYEYSAADRNDCRVFTNEWCHYSCTHYPPVCPNCCVKL